MTSNSLFCGFNYLNVYLYVLAVSWVPYDWWEELIELATNSADAGFPCGWRSNLGWVGMDTSHYKKDDNIWLDIGVAFNSCKLSSKKPVVLEVLVYWQGYVTVKFRMKQQHNTAEMVTMTQR